MKKRKVLVIGNGPSIKDEKRGHFIDSFDGEICRFNSFRFQDSKTGEDLREYTGERCDMWVTTDCFPKWAKMYDYKRVFYMSFDMSPEEQKFLTFKEIIPKAEKIPRWAWNQTGDRMGFSGCSSGAIAVYYFQTLYEEVHLYGFDFFQGATHHYGDTVGSGTLHKADFEKRYFMQMIVDGTAHPFCDYLGTDVVTRAKEYLSNG